MLGLSVLYGAEEGFQEVEKQEQEAFKKKIHQELIAQTAGFRGKVKAIYEAINYQPVWVDKDYLSHHTELLIVELKEDFKKGLYQDLIAEYKVLLPDDNHIFHSDSIEDKTKVEIGIMKLYVKVIDKILKNHKSKHTSLSLIQKALEEQDLIAAINDIDHERIMHEIASSDMNLTKMKENQEAYAKLTKRLLGDDKQERLIAMYELLKYKPIWVTQKGLTPQTKVLFSHIENDITLDNNASVYLNYKNISAQALPKEKETIATREHELAKLYQDYMSYVLYGDINWKKFQRILRKTKRNGVWNVHEVLATPESFLIKAVQHDSFKEVFEKAKPQSPLYDRLLVALEKYQKITEEGGWETLADFENLKPGMSDAVVPALRERLKKEGDFTPCENNVTSNKYDSCLKEAVQRFQVRHGLEAEGYIGKMTKKALSVSAQEKVVKIKLNLNRIKWLKRSDDRYHIFINIPSFSLYMFDGSEIINKMRVITGKKGHESPIFYGRVRTIVLNPYWRIPPSIIRHETIPKLQRDPGYTNKKRIEIHIGYSEHSPKVNPYSVNWHKYGKKLPPYKFMQSPGVKNALGKVKYLFPNKYSVYMHDTNQKNLFVKDYRALSHGCVRLQKPFELLETFSKIEPSIDFQKAQAILEKNKKTPYRLAQTIPVDIIYLTSLVDTNGTVMFFDDVYGYDKMQFDTSRK